MTYDQYGYPIEDEDMTLKEWKYYADLGTEEMRKRNIANAKEFDKSTWMMFPAIDIYGKGVGK